MSGKGERLLRSKTVDEVPQGWIGTGHHSVESSAPSFSYVRRSGNQHLGSVVLVPRGRCEVGVLRGSPYPGVLVITQEGVHVRRDERFQMSPGLLYVVLWRRIHEQGSLEQGTPPSGIPVVDVCRGTSCGERSSPDV